ncbi:MAG TPA: hypothetical protein VI685_17460, partial [Candidatus Angelobacter sp.]
MNASAKFGITDLLCCVGYGFAASFLLAAVLFLTVPQILAGGHTEGAGGLDNVIRGLMIVFFVGGILFSLAAGWVLAIIRGKPEATHQVIGGQLLALEDQIGSGRA